MAAMEESPSGTFEPLPKYSSLGEDPVSAKFDDPRNDPHFGREFVRHEPPVPLHKLQPSGHSQTLVPHGQSLQMQRIARKSRSRSHGRVAHPSRSIHSMGEAAEPMPKYSSLGEEPKEAKFINPDNDPKSRPSRVIITQSISELPEMEVEVFESGKAEIPSPSVMDLVGVGVGKPPRPPSSGHKRIKMAPPSSSREFAPHRLSQGAPFRRERLSMSSMPPMPKYSSLGEEVKLKG